MSNKIRAVTATCNKCRIKMTSAPEEMSHKIRRDETKRVWVCRECALRGQDEIDRPLFPELKTPQQLRSVI